MRQLEQDDELGAAVRERLAPEAGPVLGICPGLQALYGASEENGGTRCLGILGGAVRRFDAGTRSAGAAGAMESKTQVTVREAGLVFPNGPVAS